jgi:hypothetical protein
MGLQALLELTTVVSVIVQQDCDSPVRRQPGSIAAEASWQLVQKVQLVVRRVNVKRCLISQDPWQHVLECYLGGGLLYQKLNVHFNAFWAPPKP